MRELWQEIRLSHVTVWEHTAESVQPSLKLSVAARTKKKKCMTTVNILTESSWECACVWKKKRTAIRGRVSTLFLELTCCDINEDFRLIRSMQLKELRPVFFQHHKGRRARSEHLDGYPEPLQHVHRRSCSSRTGWSCANFERTPDRAITKIRQQRKHTELRSTRTPAHGWV